ncbi:MAG: ABC transporter substrate-binding protein, partial [Thermoplasmata archaeon]
MLAISAMILAVPISGLIGVVDDAVAQTQERVLRIGFMQEIDSMNPYIGLNDASYVFYGLIYDALGVIDEDMNPEPDLALEAWPVPEGYDDDPNLVGMPYGSVWQYNLTRNAYWTDGEPFTADDVVFNIELNYQNYDAMWAYQPYSYFMSGAWKIDD